MGRSLRQLLEMGEEAFSNGDYEDALALADEALAAAPGAEDALDLKANAHAALGEYEAADELFATLMQRHPKEPAWALSAADVLIRQPGDDRDRIEDGLDLLDRIWPQVKKDRDLSLEVQLLRGVGLNQLGELEAALDVLAEVLDVEPGHPEARLERAIALFELARFDEARSALEKLSRDEPEEPWAWHYRGLIAERQGQDPEPLLAKARALAPEEFPPAVHLSAEAFDQAVQDAIADLPPQAKGPLENAVIDVEPIPTDDELREGGVSPAILGIFRGVPVDERSPTDASHHQTARITLYQKNLERFATTREELLEQIRITVLHEVGHLLGLDEDELYERGLD